MQTFIAIKLRDGRLDIRGVILRNRGTPPPGAVVGADGWWEREPNAQTLTGEVLRTWGALAESYRVMSDAEVAAHEVADRRYRNAYVDDGKALTYDMPKARELCRDILRFQREQPLAALDVDFMRALEAGDAPEQQRIVAEKQTLRDITADPRIDAAASVDELKAITLPEG